MDHQKTAGAIVCLVEAVGKAGIDRKIVVGVGIHLRRRNGIESLRRLPVAFVKLRPEIAGPAADRIGLEDLEVP